MVHEDEGGTQSQQEGALACRAWMQSVDRAVDEAGVRDGSAHRIAGFPYVRVDRFSASLASQAASGVAAFDAWVARLYALDLQARGYELRNLPVAALESLHLPDRDAVARRTAGCEAALMRDEMADPARRGALLQAAAVPDDYAEWVGRTGVYDLTTSAFAAGVAAWHKESEEMFRQAATGAAHGPLQVYGSVGGPVPEAQVRAIFARVRHDALGIPRLGPQEAEVLFRAYAPQYEIETTGAHDRFGPLAWGGGVAPEVDTATPAVYRRLAYTRYEGRVLLQLVYTAWFPERPAEKRFDILAGTLDGVVFRVTLDEDGRPLAYDTIHPCGCYHMFFPTALVKVLPAPNARDEWAMVPGTLPVLRPGGKVAVRIASKSHYVVGVRPVEGAGGIPYAFIDDDDLRALRTPDGHTRSMFGPDGLVAGTERPERLLFWPRGITSPGTMRQWGRQPTAFIGRRHFDDADLIDKRFARADPVAVGTGIDVQ